MLRSLARLKVDPSLIVQKRLPAKVRRQQLQRPLWQDDATPPETGSQPGSPDVVLQIAQAARRRSRDQQLWTNLLGQALAQHEEFAPQDMASVLWSMSEGRYRHDGLINEFVRSLAYRASVKTMVTAMLALDRLELPTAGLRGPFLQQLGGQCESLSFGECRRILMALARCCRHAAVPEDVLSELCATIVLKSHDTDPRDLVAVPQHLGRLRYPHAGLLYISTQAIGSLVASRIGILPLDALRAFDGLILLLPLYAGGGGETAVASRERIIAIARKCKLLGADLARGLDDRELWALGSQLVGAEVKEPQVWAVWAREAAVHRCPEGKPATQHARGVRRRVVRQWGAEVEQFAFAALPPAANSFA